ncbi:MAG: transcription termination factor Rho [Acidimicrobiia bacterium]|nr:transcription termination factor Rho [Acidimicrobiia bacterium]
MLLGSTAGGRNIRSPQSPSHTPRHRRGDQSFVVGRALRCARHSYLEVVPMSVEEQALERSVLERKERDELAAIAEAMGVKAGARTSKATLISQILREAGIETEDDKPKRATKPKSANGADDAGDNQEHETTEQPAAETTESQEPASSETDAANDTDADTSGSAGQQDQREQPKPQEQGQQGQERQEGRGNQQGYGGGVAEPGNRRSRRRRGRDRSDRGERGDRQPQDQGEREQQFQGEPVPVEGLLDLRDEGYGFLRTGGYLSSQKDVYVSLSQVRRFALRKGDFVSGASRPASSSEKYPALLRIDTVNGMTPDEARARPRFEELTPLFPDQKLRLEVPGDTNNMVARIVDLLSPIGKGQRGLIVSPPKAGKTTVLKQIAHSIETNNPEVHLMVLLVDERPEEVTDMRRSVKGEVVSSTFDRPSEEHTQVAELAIERAKRLVEMGKDVVIVLDGITRLARAYNLAAPASGRILSGGVDSAALYPPKKFFGSARNIEEGGSLTILATALIETGSRMDEVIFEEFKGTGNMELRLDRKLAERRIYPSIDVDGSSTRHEELLFERHQLQQVWKLRRVLNALEGGAGLELLMDKIKTTKSNDEFLGEIAKAPTPTG